MQRIVIALFAMMLVLRVAATAQNRPDFSGVWKMDPSRSESAHQAEPIGSVTLVIKQTVDELSVETRRGTNNNQPTSSETLIYRLDGSESSAGPESASIKVKARWDGVKLITETARSVRGSAVNMVHVFSVDPSGRDLTIDKTLTVQHGYQFQGANNTGTGKDVFVRARGSSK